MAVFQSDAFDCVPKWSSYLAKVLRRSHRTTFDKLWNMSECHEVPRLPHETMLHDVWNLQKWPLCSTPHRHGPRVPNRVPTRSCCRQLRTHKQRRANTGPPPDPQSKTKTLRYAFDLPVTSQWPHNGHTGIMLSRGNHPNIPLIIRVVYSYKIYPNIWGDEHNSCQILMWKTRPANQPECSHVKHFCEQVISTGLYILPQVFRAWKTPQDILKRHSADYEPPDEEELEVFQQVPDLRMGQTDYQ